MRINNFDQDPTHSFRENYQPKVKQNLNRWSLGARSRFFVLSTCGGRQRCFFAIFAMQFLLFRVDKVSLVDL